MRPLLTLALATGVSLPASIAQAEGPISADEMTVSGRLALRTASGTSLAGRLRVQPAPLPAAVREALAPVQPARGGRRLPPSPSPQEQAAAAAWESAVGRSFINHGYMAPGDASAGAAPVIVEVEALTLTPSEAGLAAVARLSVRPADASGPACLSRQIDGRFHALRRAESGLGQRIVAVVAGVGMAAAGAPGAAGSFMANQFMAASADNAARNALIARSDEEAVAPEFGDEALTRFATMNAQRLALTGYLRWLGETRPCETPAAASEAAAIPAAATPGA